MRLNKPCCVALSVCLCLCVCVCGGGGGGVLHNSFKGVYDLVLRSVTRTQCG